MQVKTFQKGRGMRRGGVCISCSDFTVTAVYSNGVSELNPFH